MITTQSKLTRTATQPSLPEGMMYGQIKSIEVKEMKSSYTTTGVREAVNVKLRYTLSNGEEGYVYYSPSLTWSTKGKFMQMLKDLDAVPEINEELNIPALIDMKVRIYIKTVEADGKTYSNVERIEKYQLDDNSTEAKEINIDQYPGLNLSPDDFPKDEFDFG